jgi:hypothetical protein
MRKATTDAMVRGCVRHLLRVRAAVLNGTIDLTAVGSTKSVNVANDKLSSRLAV